MYKLVIVHQGRIQKNIPLHRDSITIGRSKSSDICLKEKLVSSQHAIIDIDNNKVTLSDLDSTNGTTVNGKNISRVQLQTGDQITIGNYKLIFITDNNESDDPDATMMISTSNNKTQSSSAKESTNVKKSTSRTIFKGLLLIIIILVSSFFMLELF